jgi:hypothetical protein
VSEPPIPSAPADLELIAQLKNRLQYAELKIRVLEERLRLMRIEKYGAGGEKLSHAQMELFEPESVVSEVIVQAEGERAPTRRSTKNILQTSRPPGVASESSSRRADSALRAGSARMQTLRQRNRGDRLRGEFPVGCRASEVLRAGHETRETGLPEV